MKLADLPVRTILGVDILAPVEVGQRRPRPDLTDDEVRYIRRVYWRGVRWREALNQKYPREGTHWKLLQRKGRVVRKVVARYGQEALARRFSRSSVTILDIVHRNTFQDVD